MALDNNTIQAIEDIHGPAYGVVGFAREMLRERSGINISPGPIVRYWSNVDLKAEKQNPVIDTLVKRYHEECNKDPHEIAGKISKELRPFSIQGDAIKIRMDRLELEVNGGAPGLPAGMSKPRIRSRESCKPPARFYGEEVETYSPSLPPRTHPRIDG